jgi:hypothetical protein
MPGLCVAFVAGTAARPPKWLPYKGKGRGALRPSLPLTKKLLSDGDAGARG